jgi:hypothetical protein
MERQHITIDPCAVTFDLSCYDLDRMVRMQRLADECPLPRAAPITPPGLCAYAPDPDADYAQGVTDGYLLGLNAAPPVQWMPKTVPARDQWIKLALFVVFIAVLTWAVLQ